ncbi:MAG: DMT family transporter [Lactobacillaceae bacterium]|jgi:transporter family-2 protein|nr:DMT family transporter [Lactobacillaceae bacterium]
MFLIYVLIGVGVGLMLANQKPINNAVRQVIKSPFQATFISFLISSLITGIVALFSGTHLFPTFRFIFNNPWWLYLGGVVAAIYIASNIILFPKIGVVETVVIPSLGQIIFGVLLSQISASGIFGHKGFFEFVKPIALDWKIILGSLLGLIGIYITSVIASNKNSKEMKIIVHAIGGTATGGELLAWRIWAFIVGGLTSIQQVINGALGKYLNSSPQAAFLIFFIGLVIVALVALIKDKSIIPLNKIREIPWWGWLGGGFGALVGIGRVMIVPELGPAQTAMIVLFGSILGSLFVQQLGWWRTKKANIHPWQIIGLIVMLIGIALINNLF